MATVIANPAHNDKLFVRQNAGNFSNVKRTETQGNLWGSGINNEDRLRLTKGSMQSRIWRVKKVALATGSRSAGTQKHKKMRK